MSRNLCIMHIVGTVDGCGYDSQLKYTICEACRPYHSILSILRPVFRHLDRFVVIYIPTNFNTHDCIDATDLVILL